MTFCASGAGRYALLPPVQGVVQMGKQERESRHAESLRGVGEDERRVRNNPAQVQRSDSQTGSRVPFATHPLSQLPKQTVVQRGTVVSWPSFRILVDFQPSSVTRRWIMTLTGSPAGLRHTQGFLRMPARTKKELGQRPGHSTVGFLAGRWGGIDSHRLN